MKQTKKIKVFISHAEQRASSFGSYLKPWLGVVLGDNADVWISSDPKDMTTGKGGYGGIIKEAKSSNVCLSILTPENYKRPWMLFEPGIFFGGAQNKQVQFLLCGGLTHNRLQSEGYPIEGIGVYPEKEKSVLTMINTINKLVRREDELLKNAFNSQKESFLVAYRGIFPETAPGIASADGEMEDRIAKLNEL